MLWFFWTFPARTDRHAQKFYSSSIPCRSRWERCPSEAKTERVNRDRQDPLSRLRRQLSQREPRGRCEYVQFSIFRWYLLLTAPIQRQYTASLMPAPTGGAYQSVRIVTQCDCRNLQISFYLKRTAVQAPYPKHSFLPNLFSCERKDWAVGDTCPLHGFPMAKIVKSLFQKGGEIGIINNTP